MVNLSTWAILPARNERAMEIAVAKIGPIAASINASPYTFQHYQLVIHSVKTFISILIIYFSAQESMMISFALHTL